MTSNSISSYDLSVSNANIKHLNVELSNVDYGISSLQDLSNDIYNEFNRLSGLSDDVSYLSSELSDYHNTLSGIDRS